jgi:hypothetical protein
MTHHYCMYCETTAPSLFSGREHVVPQAFGKFGANTPTLRCVCDECNGYFGKHLDQMLARETYEGLLRYRQGMLSTEKRIQRRLRFTLADEREAEGFLGALVDGVDPTTNQVMQLATQLQIKNLENGKTEIFTRRDLLHLELPKEVFGSPGERELIIFAPSKKEHDAFVEELNAVGLDLRMGTGTEGGIVPSIGDDGIETLGVHIEGTFDDLHRRALAKILVNFCAFYVGEDVANAPPWAPVKRFIRYSDGKLPARLSDKPFWTGQESQSLRYPDAINIRLENHERGVVGVIQFYNRITYELLLVEGGCLPKEFAARFVAGSSPIFGQRGLPC